MMLLIHADFDERQPDSTDDGQHGGTTVKHTSKWNNNSPDGANLVLS
jgi:hypothetical protein